MKQKFALSMLALAIMGVSWTPSALAAPSADSGKTLIACPWAKWFLDERQWQYGHRFHDHDRDFHDSMIDDDDFIPEPPPIKTVEQWEGNKKIIRVIPNSGETQVVIFGAGKLNQVETP